MTARPTTLVIGATGKTGRRVVDRLRQRNLPVRAASRTGAVRFDWDDPTTWRDALRGADAMYLTFAPDLASPAAAPAMRALMPVAVDCGVRRIVLLSGRGEPQVLPSEQAVRDAGVPFTILRASWFCQNFSEGQLADPVRGGELAFPGGDAAEPFIDVEDIADVAVAALTEDGHAGATYELTGPRLLTFTEAVAEISRAAGRTIRYVPVSTVEYAGMLAPYMPAAEAGFLAQLFGELLDGHNAHVTDGVQRVLGRPARDFRAFALDAAAAWR
jgi:uncharacterized protein YbjT (DUF2867 family)